MSPNFCRTQILNIIQKKAKQRLGSSLYFSSEKKAKQKQHRVLLKQNETLVEIAECFRLEGHLFDNINCENISYQKNAFTECPKSQLPECFLQNLC